MQYVNPSLSDLAGRLEAMALTCDPDFDAVYEDLDREFAHLRLHRDDTDGVRMHNRLFVTLDAPADAGSEQVRKDVFNRLMDDNSFCGEGGRFSRPVCDWFVIGGRWSGLLADTLTAGAFTARARALPGMDAEFLPQPVVEKNAAALDALWHSLGGTGPNPYSRSSYLQHGYPDDAMPVTEALYDALLAEYEGIDSDGGTTDLDGDEVSRGFIGRKWLAVVDYHS